MIAAAAKLGYRTLLAQTAFSVGVGLMLAIFTPHFLVLSGELSVMCALSLLEGALLGGFLSVIPTWLILRRYRYLLRSLALGAKSVEGNELARLSDEPTRLVFLWIFLSAASVACTALVFRPSIVDLRTGISLLILAAVLIIEASLPLFVVIRSSFLSVFEVAPAEVMKSVLDEAEARAKIGRRVSRRIVAAVATPVIFLVLGSSLVVGAHSRRMDERSREETARVLARAALEVSSGVLPRAGLDEALDVGKKLGFAARVRGQPDGYRVMRGERGRATVVTPLNLGSGEVEFEGSTSEVLAGPLILVALAGVLVATGLGMFLGRALSRDLSAASSDIRDLGTDAVVSGAPVARFARFRMVTELRGAIEELAARFRVFAQAQERAILARQAAARMRGLFFASVSHDLKSPLNAILGFSHLVRTCETLSAGQSESLELIERRGRELLALIETILDAARVEAGQLSLVLDEAEAKSLVLDAISKGKDLGAERPVDVVLDIADGIPHLWVDPVRIPRAIATFIGHGIRHAQGTTLQLRVLPAAPRGVRIEIEQPSPFAAQQIRALLDPSPTVRASEHRGLALGLRLARALVELHAGKVEILDLGAQGAKICILLPGG